MKPTFIGLGAQKCASSWLYAVLKDHPQTFVSVPKELDFFSHNYGHGRAWYEGHFNCPAGTTAIGEISPSYLPHHDAPARAHEYDPTLRLIVALRDPVERSYSNHLHEIRVGRYSDSDLSFERGMSTNTMYIEQSHYAKHLMRWLDYFPVEQILLLLQEDIESDPSGQAKRLYGFLGVSESHISDFAEQRANESYLPLSRTHEHLMRSAGKFVRQHGFGWLDRLLRRTGVLAAIKNANRGNIRKIVPPMEQATRLALHAKFSADALFVSKLMARSSLPWETWEHANRELRRNADTRLTTP